LKLLYVKTDLATSLAEFDVWITPSLSDIRDSAMFTATLSNTASILEIIGRATDQFTKPVEAATVTKIFIDAMKKQTAETASSNLLALAAVLYLVTGKSDNNVKCQLPVYLKNELGWSQFPSASRRGASVKLSAGPIPRVLKAETYMEVVSLLRNPEQKELLLSEFIGFILRGEASLAQLTSLGRAYFALKESAEPDSALHLLAPLVLFQVRGSVTASGGHEPEELLRDRLEEWGLERDVDFNSSDVLERQAQRTKSRDKDAKKRAYDFIIPYKTPGWKQRIFVQCQFYSGDSGSVSHKNVDQTDASRAKVLASNADARFVEYVDGAGYASSLNGDLKKLLQKGSTASFFQVRSASIRLRRELQAIGFLTPLEVEHAVLRADGDPKGVQTLLLSEGYTAAEIERCLSKCFRRGYMQEQGRVLTLRADRRKLARRYLLLDVVATRGSTLTEMQLQGSRHILVPGFGPNWGMELRRLGKEAIQAAQTLAEDWGDVTEFRQDVKWLVRQGLAAVSRVADQ
jgi:hypothetical protein